MVLRAAIVLAAVAATAMLVTSAVDVFSGSLRPLSSAAVDEMTSNGRDLAGAVGVFAIVVLFVGVIGALCATPAALAILLLRRVGEARALLLAFGVLLLLIAGVSESAITISTAVLTLVAAVLTYVPSARAFFIVDGAPLRDMER